jgi:hypothetical protein
LRFTTGEKDRLDVGSFGASLFRRRLDLRKLLLEDRGLPSDEVLETFA